MSDEKRWQLNARIRMEGDEAGSGALIDVRTAAVYSCNESAWVALEALAGGSDAEAIAMALSERFEVTPDQAIGDVRGLFRQLEALRFLDAA